MRKKLLSILVLSMMLVSLVGCKDKNKEVKDESMPAEFNYTIEEIAEKGGMVITEDDITETPFGDVVAKEFYGNNTWEDVIFYVFDDVESAKKAYEFVKTDILLDNSGVDGNIASGQRREAMDIPYLEFYYLNNNYIVMRLDFIGDPGIASNPSETMIEYNEIIHDRIVEFW